ncbi:MAG: hypothetical protein JW743_06205 [Deltaproteobacteria bacterium]|nr:hypothetical protein [Deltaproteobacteria bacterium]MBN2845433.1 hypothetical protein [Deltaproteobacteria bacterium]
MPYEKLIIFDYSGTLSLGAVLFGRSDNLMEALQECGLTDMGVSGPDVFWESIVIPTWMKGSTTDAGYKEIMKERLRELTSGNISESRLAEAVSSFVDSYLEHSSIDPRWGRILETIQNHREILTVIATDHYAEATGSIIRHCDGLGIKASPLNNIPSDVGENLYVVANSADLGCHKSDIQFWKTLKSDLKLRKLRRVLIIDDFGFNEQEEDNYGTLQKVEDRKSETIGHLNNVFSTVVDAVPFGFAEEKVKYRVNNKLNKKEEIFGEDVRYASNRIEQFIRGDRG